eukprot:CAMPEP_0178409228 /NCGR_PEP_ID=MMETSP0689_2-20121128/20355_1 /TAXON_ID=160604 /ORGANISM="Amphidinium massartii, Strain CS-259" /LENGTH=142 /DNA_ID=CAMNT_0020030365 /DNA_START=107 /DNA_END=532 /DNA_ORIENTATION=+
MVLALAAAVACAGCMSFTFVAPSSTTTGAPQHGAQLRGGVAEPAAPAASSAAAAFVGSMAVAGAVAAAMSRRSSKVTRQYTTQIILPSLTWLKSGVSAGELAPGELRAVTLGGNDVLLGKTESGSLFGVSNLCPHIGTPLSE